MNLREQAEADNAFMLEDSDTGFGVEIILTDSDSYLTSYTVKGQYHRVGVTIDPDTGLPILGNKSAVTIRLSSLGAGILPETGWTVQTTDITGETVNGIVDKVALDRTAGRATLILRGA